MTEANEVEQAVLHKTAGTLATACPQWVARASGWKATCKPDGQFSLRFNMDDEPCEVEARRHPSMTPGRFAEYIASFVAERFRRKYGDTAKITN